MAYRLFEGKDHASAYLKYRSTPPAELRDIIIKYLDKKKGPPHVLAVDLGCGSGQNTRLMAPHFREVVGMDISESQLEEARAVPGYPNITYRKGTAEDLPFPDGSVDLLTAATAAHWFDQAKFLVEADRVLKPGGCMALLGSSVTSTKFSFRNCGDRLNQIFNEIKQQLEPYTSNAISVSASKLEPLYSAIPYLEKERIDCFQTKSVITVRNLLGFIRSLSMFQTFKKNNPERAEELLVNTQKRFLDEMEVTSLDTEIEREWEYFCVLASKPRQLNVL